MKKILFAITLAVASTTINAQLVVDSIGRVGIGTETPLSLFSLGGDGDETIGTSFYNKRTGEVLAYQGYSASCPSDLETVVCISAHNMIPLVVEAENEMFIQNQTLTDGGYYEAKTIKVGNHVTTTEPQGDVTFSHGSYHLAGKRVELHPGTKISVGTTMRIRNR